MLLGVHADHELGHVHQLLANAVYEATKTEDGERKIVKGQGVDGTLHTKFSLSPLPQFKTYIGYGMPLPKQAPGGRKFQVSFLASEKQSLRHNYNNSPDVTVLDQHTGVVDGLGQTLLENLRGRGKRSDPTGKVVNAFLCSPQASQFRLE